MRHRHHRLVNFVMSLALLASAFVIVPAAAAQEAEPIVLEGRGQTATDPFFLPAPDSMITFTHDGTRNFIVRAYAGDRPESLVNTIGAYRGARPISSTEPVTLDIQADGPWTATVTPIPEGGTLELSGTGDTVSGWFDSPGRTTLDITHDGSRNFIVRANCAGRSESVQNLIGPTSGSRVVTFPAGPCYWDVRADGNWSLTPR